MLLVLDFMFKDNKKHLLDYRVSLIKTTALRPKTDVCVQYSNSVAALFVCLFIYFLIWNLHPCIELDQAR